jgi:hypothetical protein
MRPDLSSERAPHMGRTVTFKQEETSGHEPQPGFDTKTDRLIDRQSQCDVDFDLLINIMNVTNSSIIVVILVVFSQCPSILQLRLCILCNYNKYLYTSSISGCLYTEHNPTHVTSRTCTNGGFLWTGNENSGYCLVSWATISFSRMTLMHLVNRVQVLVLLR